MTDTSNPERFTNKIAIVTGGARGIGLGIATRLASEGAHVVIADIDAAEGQRAAEAGRAAGYSMGNYPVDVADDAATSLMAHDLVMLHGHIDILINNAGISDKTTLFEMTPDAWDHMQNVNVRGLLFCTQAVARHMVARVPDAVKNAGRAAQSFGKIVNIASVAGRRGRADAVHYSVSKAAVITITQAVAMELAPFNINVNAVCPVAVWTRMYEHLDSQMGAKQGFKPGEAFRQRIERIPLKRGGTVEDVAGLVAFLCSTDADYITAQAYNVDGGTEMN